MTTSAQWAAAVKNPNFKSNQFMKIFLRKRTVNTAIKVNLNYEQGGQKIFCKLEYLQDLFEKLDIPGSITLYVLFVCKFLGRVKACAPTSCFLCPSVRPSVVCLLSCCHRF